MGLLGRQGVHLVMRMRGGRSSNTDYLAIMVTMTTINLIIMITVTLAIMTTAIMVTMTIVDLDLAIMVTLMKNTSSKSCIKDNFAEIQLWQPNVQECIIYHREYILHVLSKKTILQKYSCGNRMYKSVLFITENIFFMYYKK